MIRFVFALLSTVFLSLPVFADDNPVIHKNELPRHDPSIFTR